MLDIASILFVIPMCTNVLEYVSDSGRLVITTRHCTRIWLASGVSAACFAKLFWPFLSFEPGVHSIQSVTFLTNRR